MVGRIWHQSLVSRSNDQSVYLLHTTARDKLPNQDCSVGVLWSLVCTDSQHAGTVYAGDYVNHGMCKLKLNEDLIESVVLLYPLFCDV